MSQSIFSGLSLVRAGPRIDIAYPEALRDLAHAQALAKAHGLEVRAGEAGTWRLQLQAEQPFPMRAKAFFAALNDQRPPYPPFDPALLASGQPHVSCIVVVNENLPFVQEQLLPSLAAHSSRFRIEVVVVCNGSADLPDALPGLRVLRSDWGAVARAYNAGAAAARGSYLAFFHDDCLVHDPLWIEKCLQRLGRGAHAVAAEYRQIDVIGGVAVPALPVAKCVPLVLRASDFAAAGRFDEHHYIGYEDLDFTLALARAGKKLVATDLDIAHFHGMSSTLKYHPVPGLADLFALGAVPRFAVMRRFNEFWHRDAGDNGPGHAAMRLAMDAQMHYVLRKYGSFLSASDSDGAYARAEAALERAIVQACPEGPAVALQRLREADRAAAPAAVSP